MKRDIHIFIIWNSAIKYELEILNRIRAQFKILKQYRIYWSKNKFGKNLTSFYEEDFTLDRFQLQQRGIGPFLAIVVEDEIPTYHVHNTRRGMESVNDKVFALKEKVRNELTHTFNFHCSINENETRNNLVKLIGKNIEDFLNTEVLDGEVVELRRDCTGVNGWFSLKELFYVLNETCRYVVLRTFDAIPDQHRMDIHGDIDILVEHLPSFVCVLDPGKHCGENAYRFFNWMHIGDQKILIHAKFVGDHYYDIVMQRKMLETRVLNHNNIYIPNTEMYFWSLLYHGLFHKENYLKYEEIFQKIAPELGVYYKSDKEYLCQLLSDYLRYNVYQCSLHLDSGAGQLQPQNMRGGGIVEECPVFYAYHNDSHTVVVSEQLIRDNPKLFTRFIHAFDSILDIEKHVLVNINGICDEFNERLKKGEFLWRYSPRFGEVSELVYIHEPEQIPYFRRKFLTGNTISKSGSIIYQEEEHVDWIEGVTLDEILVEAFLNEGNEDINVIINILKDYIQYIFDNYKTDKLDYLDGKVWDAKPQNCMIVNNNYKLFDLEAKSLEPITKSFFIAKCIHQISYPMFLSLTLSEEQKIYEYLCQYFNVVCDNYNDLIKKHDDTVKEILNTPKEDNITRRYFYINSMINDFIPLTRSSVMSDASRFVQQAERIFQLDNRILQLDGRIKELDNRIMQLDKVISEKDEVLFNKDEIIIQKENLIFQLSTISESRTYKVARYFMETLKNIKSILKRV